MAGDKSGVKVTFLGDASALAAAAKKAQASLDGVSKSVGKAAAVGSFLGSAAGNLATDALGKVKAFATGSVDAFAAVEDATGAAGVQFGSALPSVLAFSDKAAASLGLSKRAALDAQNTFGTLGKAAGLSDQPLANFSQKLTSLAGDLASFKGTSTEQAIEAVGAALRGESEPIRAYGVMLNDASIQAEGLAMGLAKPVVNADKLAAANLRVKVATAALVEVQKKHRAGSIEVQKAQGALVSAQAAVKAAATGSIPPLSATNKTLAIQSLILKQTKDAQGDYSRTSKSTANVQKTLAAETENAQAKLGKKLAPAVTAVRLVMLNAIRSMTGVATALATASAFASDHATAIKTVAAIIGVVLIPTMFRLVVQYARAGAAAIASAARQVAAWLMAQAGAFATIAVMTVYFALIVAGWISTGVQAMASAVRIAAAWLIALGPVGLVIAAVVAVTALIVANWDTVKRVTVAVFNAVWGAIKGAFDWVKNHWPLLLAILTGPFGLAVLFISKHWDSIVKTVQSMPGRIRGAASGMWDGIKDAFRSALNWIVDKWNGLQFQLPSVDTHIPGVGKVGGFTIGTPDIPRLADGGIVPATPGGRLALIGEGGRDEAVIPLDRMGGGGGQPVVVNLMLDGRVIHTSLLRLKRTSGGELGLA